jgi:hypothetical protein
MTASDRERVSIRSWSPVTVQVFFDYTLATKGVKLMPLAEKALIEKARP